jgi:hypothetical protein
MRDYGVTYKSVPLMCDRSSAICLAQNSVFQERAKHKKVRYHFLRDYVEKGDIVIKYIDTQRQLADIFTKPLDATHFSSLWGGGGLVFALPTAWIEGEIVFCLIYTLSCILLLLLHFLHTHLS